MISFADQIFKICLQQKIIARVLPLKHVAEFFKHVPADHFKPLSLKSSFQCLKSSTE